MVRAASVSDANLADLAARLSPIARAFECVATVRLIPERGVSAENWLIQLVVSRDRINAPRLNYWKAIRVATYELRGPEIFEAFIRDEAGPKLQRADRVARD